MDSTKKVENPNIDHSEALIKRGLFFGVIFIVFKFIAPFSIGLTLAAIASFSISHVKPLRKAKRALYIFLNFDFLFFLVSGSPSSLQHGEGAGDTIQKVLTL